MGEADGEGEARKAKRRNDVQKQDKEDTYTFKENKELYDDVSEGRKWYCIFIR